MDQTIREFQKKLTDFIFVNEKPQRADVIFVPGNGYPQMAERAAKLWKEGMAQWIVPSGRYSVTVGKFAGVKAKQELYGGDYETECEFLCDVLQKNGVEEEAILREDQATYTYQNAIFSRELLQRRQISVRTAILCCKSTHARRCLLYYQDQFPETRFFVCPSDVDNISSRNWQQSEEGIAEVMGEAQRILVQFELYM